eukprot:1651553-Prymnesium_polylepis.1
MTLSMPTPAAKRAQARHVIDESEGGKEDDLPASTKALMAAASKHKRASGGWKGNVQKGPVSALVVATTHRRDVKAQFLEAASRASYILRFAGVCKETADQIYQVSVGGDASPNPAYLQGEQLLRQVLKPTLDLLEAGKELPVGLEPVGLEPPPGVLMRGWCVMDPFGIEPLAQAASHGHAEVVALLLR